MPCGVGRAREDGSGSAKGGEWGKWEEREGEGERTHHDLREYEQHERRTQRAARHAQNLDNARAHSVSTHYSNFHPPAPSSASEERDEPMKQRDAPARRPARSGGYYSG